MVKSIGEISVEAILDDRKFQQGVKSLVGDLKDVKVKTKDFNVEANRSNDILDSLGKGALGFGAGILAAFTGALTASPQFKAFLKGLEVPFFELSDFLGEEFQPLLDDITAGVEGFVNWFKESTFTNTILDSIKEGFYDIKWAIDSVLKAYDSLPQWLKDALSSGGTKAADFLINPIGKTIDMASEQYTNNVNTGSGDNSYVSKASKGETFGTSNFGTGYLGVGVDIWANTNPIGWAMQIGDKIGKDMGKAFTDELNKYM